MPSKTAVLDILANQQPQQRRVPDMVSTTAALSLNYNTHAGKIVALNAAGLTATLPLATAAKAGEVYTVLIKTANSNGTDHTVAVTSSDPVNGGTAGKGLVSEGSTDAVGDCVKFVSDTTGWYTVAKIGTWIAEP